MRGPKMSLVISLSGAEELELERVSRSTAVRAGLVKRARIILLLARGTSISETARLVGDQRRIVREWGRRYQQQRMQGLYDLPRPGRRPVFSPRGRDGAGPPCLSATG
jgi:hypothetical protein